jgi:3-hydroxyethyl bacteriochlorophyllide a dehydrogenase
VLGRLLARLARVTGGGTALPPTVWETDPDRRTGARGYRVIAPEDDTRRDYRVICDCSGDPTIVDRLVPHLAPGGEIVLAGFYHTPVSFAFPPAFMREARLRVAAEWKPADLAAVVALVEGGALALDGLVTHTAPATDAPAAYGTAFGDAACLKMVLDWRQLS